MLRPHACALLLAASAVAFAQPSLDPPAGPIEESGRFGNVIELTQTTTPGDADSVFRIESPGSYVLTADLVVPTNQTGIEVAANDVTIDFNGFTIRGDGSGTGVGVTRPETISESFSNLEITGGTLRDLTNAVRGSVQVRGEPDDLNNRIDDIGVRDVRIYDVDNGLRFDTGHVARCSIRGENVGIDLDSGTIEDCSVTLSGPGPVGVTGILLRSGVVRDCFVSIPTSTVTNVVGLRLFDADAHGCTIRISGQSPVGIEAPFGARLISGCTVRASAGFTTGTSIGFDSDGVIANCVAEGTDTGFAMAEGVLRSSAAIGTTTPADIDPAVTTADNSF